MCRKLICIISFTVLLCLTTGSVSAGALIQDDFEADTIDLSKWQLLNGPDVSITQSGGQVFFDRPQTQLNYLVTTEQFDPAVTPLIITGSAVTGPEGMDVWTRASNIGNTATSAQHVLDSGIRITIWPEGEANGWYDAEIIEKTAGTWPWSGITADNIPGEKVYEWDFVITDDGTTITATWTQSDDPTNTFTLTATSTTDFASDYIAFTVVNGHLNDITITAAEPPVGFFDDFETPHNYLTDGLGAYDGLLNGTIEVLDASTSRAGALYMQTANAVWDPGPGPLLYKEITGDFVATVKVTDFAGVLGAILEHNDSGIVARDPAEDGADDWVSVNYFPTWTAFVARSTDDGARVELGQTDGSWTGADTFAIAEQYPYIQLERVGDNFYPRISADGVNFIPLTDPAYQGIYDGTQTPLVINRPDLSATLQVGLMNCTYTANSGYAAFDDFQIVSVEEPEPTIPFSLSAAGDIELGNDAQVGPDSSSNGSGLGARDIGSRRRVVLISYDISELKGPVSNVSFNHFSHDQHGEVNVYGVIEDLDTLDVEALTWNTAPGVQNDPTPELDTSVALDMDDLTDVLLTFVGPGETGVRFSTDTSQALADFINSDTDGIVTFLIAASAENAQLIIRSREHSAGGTLLEGVLPAPVNPGTEGLVAYYALENDANDSSSNGLNGTIMGDPNFVEGVTGMALDVNGDDYVDCGNDPLIDMISEISVSAWLNIRAINTAWQAAVAKGENAWRLSNVNMDPRFHFGITWWNQPETYSVDGTTAVGFDEWHNVTGTYDGANVNIYLDGVLDASAPTTVPIGISTTNMFIGLNPESPGTFWDGLIDEAMIYSRALSVGEVLYLAGNRAPYTYDGDAAIAGEGSYDSLDGTWDHDNSSDAWDGSIIGEGNPGGAMTLTEDDVTFLRIQDTGDPRSLGISDPSNRKIYFGHDIGDIALDGAKLEVRIRVATTEPLDGLDPNNPWPEGGIGYHIRDNGKGMFGIGEADAVGMISFSLAKAGEAGFEDQTTDVLVMNNLVGTEASSDVDTGDAATAVNMVAIEDATAWNTFVIEIAAGGAGTHVVTVSANGGPAESFDVTVGSDNDVAGNYIAIGSCGTGGITAFDVDYITVSK